MTVKPVNADIASVAVLFGDPARASMLVALADGRWLPAGELARRASVSPATTTAHLRRLIDGGLVEVTAQGRHRYHRLANPHVASVLEALALLAPVVPVNSLRQHQKANRLAEARTCYDHLAGRRGVELRERLLEAGVLCTTDDRDHVLTDFGERLIVTLGVDLKKVQSTRRVFARSCVDWTQRRLHLAGALPAAVTEAFVTRGWMARTDDRGLRAASDYDQRLEEWLAPLPE